MKFYLIDDDPNILNILKLIIDNRGLAASAAPEAPASKAWKTYAS